MLNRPKTRGVYEREKNTDVWWIRWADAHGREHREKIGPYNLAVSAYQKRKTEVREGKLFPNLRRRGVAYENLFDDFAKHQPNHWSRGMLQISRAWFAGRPADSVTPQMITEKLNELAENGRRPATANRYRAILSAVYSWAVRNAKTDTNPARLVRLRREDNFRVRFLGEKEEEGLRREILRAAPERLPEFDLAMFTGMRRSEQYGLTRKQVDFARGLISLPKTKPGRPRYIPLNLDSSAALEILCKTNKGDRVCGTVHNRWFPKAVRAAGIRDFTWHDLRHTFASRIIMAGRSLIELQQLLGHETIQMTVRYAHLAPGHLTSAINAISKPQNAAKATRPAGTSTGTSQNRRIRKNVSNSH